MDSINEIKHKKEILKQKVWELVKEFETETSVRIKKIRISHRYGDNEPNDDIIGLYVKTRNPLI